MKTWNRNPRAIELTAPSGRKLNVVQIDCPCGCALPFTLPAVEGVTFPAPGTVLTQNQWRQLLNGYSPPGRTYRVLDLENKQCGWGGRIVLGRIFRRDDATEDDETTNFGTRVQETLMWLREKGDVR